MSKIRLAIVGCGVMGNRHLNGFLELAKSGLSNFELVAACDLVRENAESLAKRAEESLGGKITPVVKLNDLKGVGVNAIDVTVVPWEHHTVAIKAMQNGWHVMVEKPLGVTVKTCRLIIETAERSGCVLSVAENFHYDPINILGKELLEAGVIGTPRLMLQNNVGGGSGIIVTPWRHYKRGGGPLLDVGVHYTYVTEYLMGEVESVYAHTRLHERIRSAGKTSLQADAEDAAYAVLTFKNSAVGQYIEDHAGHGQGLWQRVIYGSNGSLNLPSDRSGKPVVAILDDKGTINNERILELIPDYHLEDMTAKLFGGERIWHYDFPFSEIDGKLLAVEYYDFAESILKGRSPGVNSYQAKRSVGLTYAMLESAKLGRSVTMDEIMSEKVTTYQDEINDIIGL